MGRGDLENSGAARLVAFLAPSRSLSLLPILAEALSLLASCSKPSVLAYYSTPSGLQRVYSEKPSVHELLSIDTMLLLGGCGSVCSYSTYTLPSGSHAEIMLCTLKPLSPQALYTARPPEPQKRLARAVLEAYTRRLLRDGASLWRLVGLIASTGGGQGVLASVLSEKPGGSVALEVYAASSLEASLCMKYSEGSAVALVSREAIGEGYNCVKGVAASIKPVGGVARVESRPLQEALHSKPVKR